MLKVAIFDDEYIVLQGLQRMINWKSFGLDLIGTAENGYDALTLFREFRPDIVLTDIRMPGVNGLQLIEEIKQEAPQTGCIVFSGFNEFEYVKRAIQLDVVDYLEKPVTVKNIENALHKVISQIRKKEEALSIKKNWENSKQDLLEKETLAMLLTGNDISEKWQEYFGRDWQKVSWTTVLMASEEFHIPGTPESRVVSVYNGQEFIQVIFHTLEPDEVFWKQISEQCSHFDTAIASGKDLEGIQLGLSYQQAKRSFRAACFLNLNGLIRFVELDELICSPNELSEFEEGIILSLRGGNKTLFLEQINRFTSWIEKEKIDLEVAEHEMLKLVYLSMQIAREAGGEIHTQNRSVDMPHVIIREMSVKGKMLDWFRDQMMKNADSFMATREDTKHIAVERARLYIEMNISRDLSLQEVADHVGMNATYLSVLFKEVMGVSYIKFLTHSRMELAKKLLSQGMKVNDVSLQIGYHTYRHFSEVFKKYTGLTPGQFKEETENRT